MKYAKVLFLLTFLFVAAYSAPPSFAAPDNTIQDNSTITALADELYLKFQSETKTLDKAVININSKDFENVIDGAALQLAPICTGQQIQKYIDKMKNTHQYQKKFEPFYPISDTLLKSRIIELTPDTAVVRQFREIKDEDTEWGGKGQTHQVVKYVFLAKDSTWKIKDILDTRQLNLGSNDVVIDTAYSDINGDSEKEPVYLIANKQLPEDLYSLSLKIMADGKEYRLNPGDFSGYMPKLTLCDLNGDRLDDLFVSIQTGGSSGASLYYAFTLKDNQPSEFFGPQQNLSGLIPLTMKFLDGYKVSVINTGCSIDTIVDISANKQYYENARIYTDGKLNDKKTVPVADPYVSLTPKDIDNDGQYELIGTQYIWGFWHADTLFEFNTTLKYIHGKWELVNYLIQNRPST